MAAGVGMLLRQQQQHSPMFLSARLSPAVRCQRLPAAPLPQKMPTAVQALSADAERSFDSSSSSNSTQLQRVLHMQQLLLGGAAPSETAQQEPCVSSSAVSGSRGTKQAGFGGSDSSTARRRQQQHAGQQHHRAISSDDLCPCCSQLRYRDCCQPLLDGAAVARSAPEVVRARITAALRGEVSYLVTTTHPDSVLTLGGSRNMRSLYRRQGSLFKSNKVKVVGMAHCRGDSDGTWVVLSILQSTVGDFAGVKVPFMVVVAKQNWQEGPAAAFSELFADRKAQGSGRQYSNSMNNADTAQQWMFLKSTTEFPDNSDSGVLVELMQQHVPELLNNTEDETGWQGHQQQSRMTGRQLCFIWDTPHLSIGFGHEEKQVAPDGDADATGMGGWYVDLLQPAAEKFSKNVDVSSQGSAEADASPLLLPPGVFCMDEYLARVAAQPWP